MSPPQWIVVGAGFTVATVAERIASQLDQRVLVIDRRDHVGGNAFDYAGPRGIMVHKYGPHIFHSNSRKVWDYLSQFTEWRPYFHRVLAHVDGQYVPLPFNLVTVEELFPARMAADIIDALVEGYGYGARVPVLRMRESGDSRLQFLAGYVYEKVFENYTFKQWSLRPEELSPSVSGRVPIVVSRDCRYFHDTYQAMPSDGFAVMFARMLNHPNIRVETSTDFRAVRGLHPDARIVFTGPIDEYFEFAYGTLPYRSLRFEVRERDEDRLQEVGTINYPNEFDLTRITEMKHLSGQKISGTLLVEEYPEPYVQGTNEPYYPVPTERTAQALKPYQQMVRDLKGKVWLAGRLGDYAYYNMDQACGRALALFEKQLANG